jgi:hypothetical protein
VVFTIAPQTTGDWKVYVPAADARTEGVSSPVTVQVQSLVTAEPRSPRVPRGGSVIVKAWSRPFVAKQRVALELKVGDGWKTVATERVNGKGRARLVADAPREKGRYVYRVVAIGRGGLLANASTDIPIRVTK